MMGSVRIANNDRESALEVAAECVENGVRTATDDCVRKAPEELVVEHPDSYVCCPDSRLKAGITDFDFLMRHG